MFKDSWVIYAILSAVFAALTSILAKIGISDINSNLATAIRTIVVLIMAWGIVIMTGAQSGIQDITRQKAGYSLYFRELPQVFLGYSTTKHFNSVMRQK